MDYSLRTELNKIAAIAGSEVVAVSHDVLYMPQNVGYHNMGPFFASAVITYEVASDVAAAPSAPPASQSGIPAFPFTTPESMASIRRAISGGSARPEQ
jgi:hypothetical protein